MSKFRTLDDARPAGKRVLLRLDLNVPMEGGKVTDATRIERVLPTIREIAKKGGKAILLAPAIDQRDRIRWFCVPIGVSERFLPQACRSPSKP